jgi:hypothetical protein
MQGINKEGHADLRRNAFFRLRKDRVDRAKISAGQTLQEHVELRMKRPIQRCGRGFKKAILYSLCDGRYSACLFVRCFLFYKRESSSKLGKFKQLSLTPTPGYQRQRILEIGRTGMLNGLSRGLLNFLSWGFCPCLAITAHFP